ncbi:hypothetical protein AOL_s00215g659 [Orbilia oligospora ATCC 24927]|uniref:NACHT domain-containing protein n=1 Tax=Arthrobotrys oligospora (strain ATCC 24927 / CBS 115.81 / DSM 1491) TaxID=756982 RepID=G1XUK1_ARTOA|nr:hypothetical protein AOL_s00215g659 [Orbilia oligospora ATCC 24927]EGX43203.1 hypothetical protein AOL_s00215g659 [Orbilia oligospora ATCC 24927]
MDLDLDTEDYTIGWICALPLELEAATAVLDKIHPELPIPDKNDTNSYKFGQIGSYNIVLACLPSGSMGTTSAAVVVANMHRSFPSVENCLMVGIGGGAPLLPQNDIRLGDVVVGIPKGNYGGVLPYLFGKTMQESKFVQTGRYLNGPPTLFLNAISKLRSEQDSGIHTILADALSKESVSGKFARPGVDHLYEMDYDHLDETKSCSDCDSSKLVTRPVREGREHQLYIHYGLIASGDQVMRHGKTRDKLSREQDVLCFEMEAEGIVNTLPFLVIRGICDYSDSHKNKIWQPYAALVAAAFAKALILCLPVRDSNEGGRSSKIRISLPVARGATFGSFGTEGEPMCLNHTRENLLRVITDWATTSDIQTTKQIFWLSGGAGTGKSTIARTVAKFLKDEALLGGSFFFRRGTEDCSKAERFITTLAADLRFHVRGVNAGISKALGKDPRITEKNLGEQFEELIQKPLMEAKPIRRTTLVIDALDECENENHVLAIVRFLALLTDIDNSITVFITSRGETFINDIFKALPQVVQKRVLHDIEELEIESDIRVFFQHELATIRAKGGLAEDWPTSTGIESLVKIASPLFIVAANICRFLDDRRFRPDVQLSNLLGCESGPIIIEANADKSLQWTYRHILTQSLAGTTRFQRATIIREFKEIIGIIVLLEQPLSLPCLSRLISMDEKDVETRLEGFHSVLNIPTDLDGPISTLHLSFREFLLDVDMKANNPFWLDEREIHRNIAQYCIKLMRDRLKKNICGLRSPGIFRNEISSSSISQTLTADIAYACRYWVTHLVKARDELKDEDEIHQFLQNYCLEWLEATALMDLYSNNIYAIAALKSILSAPLQVYHSALLWSPAESLMRKRFFGTHLRWVKIAPNVSQNWESWTHIFEDGKNASIIKFSHDSQSIATYTYSPKCITIRDCTSGALRQKINLDRYWGEGVHAMEFLPDGRSLVLIIGQRVDILDLASGKFLGGFDIIENQTLQSRQNPHAPWPQSSRREHIFRLSLDGRFAVVVEGSGVVKMWSIDSRKVVQSFEFPVFGVAGLSLEISPNLEYIAVLSYPSVLYLQNTRYGSFFKNRQVVFIVERPGMKFSPDSRYLVYVTKRVKDSTTTYLVVSHRLDSKLGLQEQRAYTIKTKFDPAALEFVSNEKIALSGWENGSIEIWDLHTGAMVNRLFAHRGEEISLIAASPNYRLWATSGDQTGVRLWNILPQELGASDVKVASSTDQFEDSDPDLHRNFDSVLDQNLDQNSGMFQGSPWSDSRMIFYDLASGRAVLRPRPDFPESFVFNFVGHSVGLPRGCFSPDGKIFVSAEPYLLLGSDTRNQRISIFDAENSNGEPVREFIVYMKIVGALRGVSCSCEGDLLAVHFGLDADIKVGTHIWKTGSWEEVKVIDEPEPIPQLIPKTTYSSNAESKTSRTIQTELGPVSFNMLTSANSYDVCADDPRCELDLDGGWIIRRQTKDKVLWLPEDIYPMFTREKDYGSNNLKSIRTMMWKSSFAYFIHNRLQLLELDFEKYEADNKIALEATIK